MLIKPLIDYMCDPNKVGFCRSLYEWPDRMDPETIPKAWTYMMTGLVIFYNVLGWRSGGWTIQAIGWHINSLFTNFFIVPAAVFALLW